MLQCYCCNWVVNTDCTQVIDRKMTLCILEVVGEEKKMMCVCQCVCGNQCELQIQLLGFNHETNVEQPIWVLEKKLKPNPLKRANQSDFGTNLTKNDKIFRRKSEKLNKNWSQKNNNLFEKLQTRKNIVCVCGAGGLPKRVRVYF